MTKQEIIELRKSGDEVGSFHEALNLINELEAKVKNLSSNTVLGDSLPIKSNCPDCG